MLLLLPFHLYAMSEYVVGALAVVLLEQLVFIEAVSFIETVVSDSWNSNLFFLPNFPGEWGGLPVRAKPHEPCICIYVYERAKY